MQYKFFRISAVTQGENSYWAMAVEYLAGEPATQEDKKPRQRNRVDYRELLNPEDFALFARLREWRKRKAEQEAVPVYTIFTN